MYRIEWKRILFACCKIHSHELNLCDQTTAIDWISKRFVSIAMTLVRSFTRSYYPSWSPSPRIQFTQHRVQLKILTRLYESIAKLNIADNQSTVHCLYAVEATGTCFRSRVEERECFFCCCCVHSFRCSMWVGVEANEAALVSWCAIFGCVFR